MAKQKQKLTEENLAEIIEREVGQSVSYSGELDQQRRKAMEYYNASQKKPNRELPAIAR